MNEGIAQRESAARVDGIVALLGKGISWSDELLALLEEELQAILKVDMVSLRSLCKQKMHLVDRLQQLDRSVAEQAEALSGGQTVSRRQTGKNEGKASVHLAILAESSPQEQKERLCRSRDRFVSRRRAIADKNHINRRLLEDSLGYLNDAISLLTRTSNEPSYGRKAGGKNKSYPVLVSRAV